MKFDANLLAIAMKTKDIYNLKLNIDVKNREMRMRKHLLKGKTTSHRRGRVDKKYKPMHYALRVICDVMRARVFMFKSDMLFDNKSLIENLEYNGYLLKHAENEIRRFSEYINMRYRKRGEFYEIY